MASAASGISTFESRATLPASDVHNNIHSRKETHISRAFILHVVVFVRTRVYSIKNSRSNYEARQLIYHGR